MAENNNNNFPHPPPHIPPFHHFEDLLEWEQFEPIEMLPAVQDAMNNENAHEINAIGINPQNSPNHDHPGDPPSPPAPLEIGAAAPEDHDLFVVHFDELMYDSSSSDATNDGDSDNGENDGEQVVMPQQGGSGSREPNRDDPPGSPLGRVRMARLASFRERHRKRKRYPFLCASRDGAKKMGAKSKPKESEALNVKEPLRPKPEHMIQSRVAKFFLSQDCADVEFVIKPSPGLAPAQSSCDSATVLPAHKMILATGSPVFQQMFYGEMATKTTEGNKCMEKVEIVDSDPESFRHFLRFIYSDEMTFDANTVIRTLHLARKYQVYNLEVGCVEYIKWNMLPEDALLVLSHAVLLDVDDLISNCWHKINTNIMQVVRAETFSDIDLPTLKLLLNRDDLSINELELFNASISWAKKQIERRGEDPNNSSLIRQELGETLYDIRFPTMTGEEFSFHVAPLGILTDEETSSIFAYFAEKPRANDATSSPNQPSTSSGIASQSTSSSAAGAATTSSSSGLNILKFPSTPRKNLVVQATTCKSSIEDSLKSIEEKELVLTRFERAVAGRMCTFDEVHKIDFHVDEKIFLTGIGVYSTRCQNGERLLTVELFEADTNAFMAKAITKITCDGSSRIIQVRFPAPVQLDARTIYTASASFDNNYPYPTFSGVNGKRIISVPVSDCKKVTFYFMKTEKNSLLDTGGEAGQIPQFIFYV